MRSLDPQIVWTTKQQLADDPIAHGTAAEAWILAMIDAEQVALLWGSVPHWSAVVDLPTTAGTAVQIPLIVPPLVDRARVVFLASGAGNVYIGGLTIAVDTSNTDQDGGTDDGILTYGVYGSDTLITVSASQMSSELASPAAYRDATVQVWSIGFQWSRADYSDLSDAV